MLDITGGAALQAISWTPGVEYWLILVSAAAGICVCVCTVDVWFLQVPGVWGLGGIAAAGTVTALSEHCENKSFVSKFIFT